MTRTALHLWMFGHPVTQDVQDSVGGGSSDDKLFVSVPLVSGETCGQVERESNKLRAVHDPASVEGVECF